MAGWFSQESRKCPEFLRHKSFLASPKMIAQQSIPLNKVVQLPGEFILTYPHGYHSGFNLGYNCAESLNFATDTWLEIGRQARACTCVPDSVTINVDAWLEEARTEGERAALKRKLDPALAENTSRYGRVVKPKIDYDDERVPAYRPSNKANRASEAKRKQAEAIPIVPDFACVFCPDMSTEGLIPLAPVPEGRTLSAQIAPRRKAGHAHKTCLLYLPTTWVDVDPETGLELGHGFETVEPARWGLVRRRCWGRTDAAELLRLHGQDGGAVRGQGPVHQDGQVRARGPPDVRLCRGLGRAHGPGRGARRPGDQSARRSDRPGRRHQRRLAAEDDARHRSAGGRVDPRRGRVGARGLDAHDRPLSPAQSGLPRDRTQSTLTCAGVPPPAED